MAGWGSLFGKIADYFQGRNERRRNQLDSLRKKYEKLLKQPQTPRNTKRMSDVLRRIGVLESQNKNR